MSAREMKGREELITSICVLYKHVEGQHVFYSDEVPGLYVMSESPETAFNDVPLALQALIKLDTGMECEVRPEKDVADFLGFLGTQRATRISANKRVPDNHRPVVLSNRRFAVAATACA